MEIWSLFTIIASLALLIFLALRGFSIIIIAPIASLVVILLNQMPILDSLQGNYMSGFMNFMKNYYLIFLFAAIFGKFMEDSGAARSIAEKLLTVMGRSNKFNALMAIVIICSFLTLGGINTYVVIFAILPIAKPLFKELNIPWHLFTGAFFFGIATFTMTMLPGSPSVQNIIPTKYLGTTTTAAPVVGIVATITIILLNCFYLKRQLAKSEARGETYENMKNPDKQDSKAFEATVKKLPPFFLSIFPPIFLIITLNVFKVDILYTLMLTVFIAMIIFWKYIDNKLQAINIGATNTVLPIINTSADVGYGTVIAATAGFGLITEMLANIPGSPLISLYVAIAALAGITGTASGGLGIAMETFVQTYLDLGVDPEALHRIAAIASGSLDSLPHNGAVITVLAVIGLTHKDAYKHIFFVSVIGPLVAAIPALIAAILIYS
ncbi:citrate transporter [Lysinibacillus contaminans]|uniref:Citrate transporter n=1 Tax=Lysinibacillus contaminans TaxID=1293441 RepID=A0ABR5K557_9BACI|nr:GntP family permease [Lysinibacillus contaminans]KOS71533.1 citrate transporter [Lysinibacillus contaminans]